MKCVKGSIIAILFLFSVASSIAVQGPFLSNGKEYYVVTSTNPSEDSGDEVCAKVGRTCVGYTDFTDKACKNFHPSAQSTSGFSGDKSGVYCNGAPQTGLCSSKINTCHTCPKCITSVKCNQAIGGLYREMYIECAAPRGNNQANQNPPGNTAQTSPQIRNACPVILYARNTQQFLNEIPSLNSRLQGCPLKLPGFVGRIISGNTVVNVAMNNGNTESATVNVVNKQITGISRGSGTCKHRVSVSEADLDSAMASKDRAATFMRLYTNKNIQVSGCTFFRRTFTAVANPITRFFVRRSTPPPPPPAPNCGQIGEQCNNRGCATGGICAAPEENLNGRWGFYDYRCIPLSDWDSRCKAHGNTRAPWDCIAYPCG